MTFTQKILMLMKLGRRNYKRRERGNIFDECPTPDTNLRGMVKVSFGWPKPISIAKAVIDILDDMWQVSSRARIINLYARLTTGFSRHLNRLIWQAYLSAK